MMKRTALALVLVLVGGAVFASGAQEDAAPGYGYGAGPGYAPRGGYNPGYAPGPAVAAEQTELTGTFDEVNGFPVIRANGKTYAVGVPGYRWMDVDLEPGDQVTVTGFLFEEAEDINGHLRVTTATINGTEYDLGAPRGWDRGGWHQDGWHRGGFGRGRGHGMMHPGYGPQGPMGRGW
jgi:hypothetical protein